MTSSNLALAPPTIDDVSLALGSHVLHPFAGGSFSSATDRSSGRLRDAHIAQKCENGLPRPGLPDLIKARNGVNTNVLRDDIALLRQLKVRQHTKRSRSPMEGSANWPCRLVEVRRVIGPDILAAMLDVPHSRLRR